MSKLLLVLEEHFVLGADGKYWSKRIIDDEYLDRYLDVFDEVIIFARINSNISVSEGYKEISRNKVSFIPMPDFHGPKGLVRQSKRIISSFKKSLDNCDVVILRSPSPISLLLYRYVPKNISFGVEFMMGANKFFEGKNMVHNFINNTIDKEAKKLVLRANGVSYVTEKQLQKFYPCKAILTKTTMKYFTTNYSSIDLNDSFYYSERRIADRKPIKLIHVGFMDYFRKGQDIAIKTVKCLRDQGYEICLELVGDGKERSTFKKIADNLGISEYVHFAGNVNSKEEIRRKLIEADIFILPSHSEGLPRVIIEAMATGLPVVASNVDGIPELIDEELQVETFLPIDYANKIKRIIDDQNFHNDIINKNYNKARQFEKNVLRERRKNFYKNLNSLAKKETDCGNKEE